MKPSRLLGWTHDHVVVRGMQHPPSAAKSDSLFRHDAQPSTTLFLMIGTGGHPHPMTCCLYQLNIALPHPKRCELSRRFWSLGGQSGSDPAYNLIQQGFGPERLGDEQVRFWRAFTRNERESRGYREVSDHDQFFLQELAKMQELLPNLAGMVEYNAKWDGRPLEAAELEEVLAIFHNRLSGLLAAYNWDKASMDGIPYYKP